MKNNYTHISILLDKSGSMDIIKNDIIGSFNSFIEEQKLTPGELTFSLSTFSSLEFYEQLSFFVGKEKMIFLTKENFKPYGSTALIDSKMKMIDETGAYLNKLNEDERPEKVLFVSITDGEENSSHNFSLEDLKAKTEEQKNKYNWEFIDLGANQDAYTNAAQHGSRGFNFSTDKESLEKTFNAMSKSTVKYRGATSYFSASESFDNLQAEIDN